METERSREVLSPAADENSRFALSQEGFVELAVTASGVHFSVFDIHHEDAVAGFWLEMEAP